MTVNTASSHAALKKLDHAELSWFHVRTIIVAGMGFFCDAYDLFSISLVTKTIGRVYYPDVRYFSPSACALSPSATCGAKYGDLLAAHPGIADAAAAAYVPSAMPTNVDAALKAIALIGTLLGQLIFGYLGDKMGRKRVFGWTLYAMVLFALLSGMSFGRSSEAVIATLCVCRLFLGVGVGGDYPLSATLMSEFSTAKHRGMFVGAVFAMQGTGLLAAAVWALFVAYLFETYGGDPDMIWRLVLAFGAVPTVLTMYARLQIPETPRFTHFVKGDHTQLHADVHGLLGTKPADAAAGTAALVAPAPKQFASETKTSDPAAMTSVLVVEPAPAPVATIAKLPDALAAAKQQPTPPPSTVSGAREFLTKFGGQLFGCASTWLLLDIAFYSQNLFQVDVFTAAGWLPTAVTMTAAQETYQLARAQALVALLSSIPGYWFTVFTVEKLGRKAIQIMGFTMMTLFMALLTGMYDNLKTSHTATFVVFYALCFFFANWGPNSTTFILPSELFPTKYRSFGHGISAASGKLGAIVGAFGFGAVKEAHGLQTTLLVLSIVNVLGLVCTYWVPETKGKTLEELADEHHVVTETEQAAPASSVSLTQVVS